MKNIIHELWRGYYRLYILRRSGASQEDFEAAMSDATVPKWLGMWNDEDFIHFIEEELFYGIKVPRLHQSA